MRAPANDRERSRDGRDGRDARDDRDRSPQPELPTEWGGRTLRTERMIEELNKRVIALSTSITELQSHCTGEATKVNAMESALPERMHKIEERQAGQVELINQFSSYVNVQLDAMNTRVNVLESARPGSAQNAPGTPGFGATEPDRFTIHSPSPGDGPYIPADVHIRGRTQMPTEPSNPFGNRVQQPSAVPPASPFPNSSTPAPAMADPWQKYGNTREHPTPPPSNPGANIFYYKDWSVSDKKVSKALNLFDSNALHYRNWADRIKDHCKEVNPSYAYIFEIIEKEKLPIPMSNLKMHTLRNGVSVDLNWVANHLWSFIGRNVTDAVHSRRLTLTQNEEDNGIELWRALFVENEGGAEQVQLGGMTTLHAFPPCPGVSDLQHWVGQWQISRRKFGNDLPEIHLRQMFLNMLPTAVAEKLRERRDLTSLQAYIDEVNGDLGRLNDARLAKVQAQRMKSTLHQGPKNPVHAVLKTEDEEEPAAPTSEHCELSKKLDGLIAVLTSQRTQQPRGRGNEKTSGTRSPRSGSPKNRPDSRFKGCLHCGDADHFRRECPEFKALLKTNGDKLPEGYKGKYERWKEGQKKKVDKVAVIQEVDVEHAETCELWAMPLITGRPIKSLSMPTKITTPVANTFDALNEDMDDESEVLEALKQLTTKIHVGPKISQKQKSQTQALSRARIAHISRQVKSGEISLPDLDFENNSDYEAVWALLDSGAGRSCAKKKKHFPLLQGPNSPSKVRMSTANGQELPSRGTFKLDAITVEGNVIQPTFEDTDVDMPIIAVTDISENGTNGVETRFRTDGGEIIDLDTRKKSSFVRRRGVYFMKMFYKPNQCQDECPCESNEPSFHRLGAA